MNRTRVLKCAFALFFAVVLKGGAAAALFSSSDGAFTVDMPSSWQKADASDAVLSLKRDGATMKVMLVKGCSNAACLSQEVNKELQSIKSKKFKILENSYTGDVIKKTEFSTGDPLYSFNFSAASVDFTSAYFLADGKAYNVGIKGLPYVEADLVLSFIAPAAKETDSSASILSHKDSEPQVSEISLDQPSSKVSSSEGLSAADIEDDSPQKSGKSGGSKINFFAILIGLYCAAFAGSFLFRFFVKAKTEEGNANPKSYYPVRGSRLYGSPDLFFKFYDNQGNNYIATSGRWGNVFMGCGLLTAVIFAFGKTFLLMLKAHGVIKLHAVLFNTILSLSSLLSIFGIIILVAGFMINLLFAYKFFVYDKNGDTAYKCVQKGFFFFKEEYVVADSKSTIVFKIKRDRFKLLRTWVIYNAQGDIAVIKEKSKIKAILRTLFGHLSGLLRAEYALQGRLESNGAISAEPKLFTYVKAEIDKPQAIDARITLITAAVIFMRDRDKWHPWVN